MTQNSIIDYYTLDEGQIYEYECMDSSGKEYNSYSF